MHNSYFFPADYETKPETKSFNTQVQAGKLSLIHVICLKLRGSRRNTSLVLTAHRFYSLTEKEQHYQEPPGGRSHPSLLLRKMKKPPSSKML